MGWCSGRGGTCQPAEDLKKFLTQQLNQAKQFPKRGFQIRCLTSKKVITKTTLVHTLKASQNSEIP